MMKSNVAIGGAILALILLVLNTVSLATTNWFVLTSGKITIDIGLFAVCLPEKCYSYGKYMFKGDGPSFSYIAFVGLNLLGCFFNLVSLITCIAHAVSSNSRPERSFIQRLSAMWYFSGGFLLAGVIWIYISLVAIDLNVVDSSLSVEPGYSFYLGCMAGVFYLIAAVAMTVVASRMPVPEIIAAGVVSPGAPQMLVMQADYSGYPPVGPTGFPDVENMGYPQHNPTNTGFPQAHPSCGYDQA